MTAKLGFAIAPNRHAATCRPDNFQLDHWIKAALRQRVASQYSPDCHQAAPRNSVTIDRFHGVLGARRHVPASRQEHGRDRPFICSKHAQRDGLGNLIHPVLNSPSFRDFCEKPRSLTLLGMTPMKLLRPSLHRLLNYFKSPANLVSQFGELKFEHRFLGIDHYIHRKRNSRPMQTNRLSQSPLYAITIDCAAQHSPNSESDAKTFALLSQQIKNGHVSGEVPTALFVNSLEVSVPE
jgi:hypothetical protein